MFHYTISVAARKITRDSDKLTPRVVDDVFEFTVRADNLNAAIDKVTKHIEAERVPETVYEVRK